MARRKVLALMTNNAGTRDDYQGSLRSGVEQACIERDLDLWVYAGRSDYRPSGEAQSQVFRLVSPSRVDGIVVAAGCLAATCSFESVLGFIRERCRVPLCSVGEICDVGSSVLVDNQAGAEKLIEHLVKVHRYRRFAYITGPQGHRESEQRLEATRRALARYGLQLDPTAVGHGNFLPASGNQVASELIEHGPAMDVLVVANDDMAVGALEALEAHGLRCPDDIAVAGFDDSAIARTSHPSLTTVRQPVERLGELAVDLVTKAWDGQRSPPCVTLQTEVVIRESCGCYRLRGAATLGAERSAPTLTRRCADEVADLLITVVDDRDRRQRLAENLCQAVHEERGGRTGALSEAMGQVISHLARPTAPINELHRVITCLRGPSEHSETSRCLEDAFNDARLRVAGEACRREGDRHWQTDMVLGELRITGEQLATALTLPALQSALISSLPRLGIKNAIVSLYERDSLERLVPWVHLADGVPVACRQDPHPAELLVPEESARSSGRRSMTVMPLTFRSENLGVALLELPAPLDAYTLVREQIASAVKTAYLHEEILNQERLNSQAQEDQRVMAAQLRSLNTIAGGVAHDLNNALGPLLALPLTIRQTLEGQTSANVPADVLEDLETIQAAGQRAAHTIHDLLSLGQATNLPKTVFDLNRLLERECGAFAGVCNGEGKVTLRIAPYNCSLPIRASKPHLVRAIVNLVLNARDALQESGVIIVRALRRDLEQPVTTIEKIEPGRYAVVEVQDTGMGIPDDLLPRILEPFFTAKRSSAGTGLGLAIVHRIVKDCSGYLHVQSRVGQGTTFGLYFPVHEGERCQLSGKPPPLLRGSERVLVVDDDVVQLRTARRVLAQLGYSVTTLDSGESALELCGGDNIAARFDLVIVDMVMRGDLNGVATVERLRQTTPDQKALIVSGFAPEQMESLAHDRGLRWLAKPYTTAQLASAVRAALDGGAPEMSTESIPPPPNVEMIAPPPHRLGHTS